MISAFSYTTITDHLWSSPSVTQPNLPYVHNVKRPPVWAVMDWHRILCTQSKQSSTNNHSRYNKSTCVKHVVTRIIPVPSAPCTQIRSRINRPSPQREGGSLFPIPKKPSTETWALEPCNSCNLQIIVDSSFLPVNFSRFEISRKKSYVHFVVYFIFPRILNLHSVLLSLVVMIDRPIARDGKSPPQYQ